ncbi:hypothetical protein DPMN_028446 [Dreissena polymorpha]|uniref:Uncharacterized protein n=1 Tax=Dreissena polymorpha TaxID=45954 RepID=A0A9D4LXA9_DREPO|nr:hypothetical protein DPMN_028446 [Dreissena polymorpha]
MSSVRLGFHFCCPLDNYFNPSHFHLDNNEANHLFRHKMFGQKVIHESLLMVVYVEDTKGYKRHAAYRQNVFGIHGRLQPDDRRTVTACCISKLTGNYLFQDEE